MFRRVLTIAVLCLAALVLVACAAPKDEPATPPVQEPTQGTATPDPGAASGIRLAPGLYDLEDGTAQAVGTLEYSDIEGGFWAIVGGTEAEGDVGKIVAVIANAGANDPEYVALKGSQVIVVGTRLQGASIRQAGPEIEAASIEGYSDTADPAE